MSADMSDYVTSRRGVGVYGGSEKCCGVTDGDTVVLLFNKYFDVVSNVFVHYCVAQRFGKPDNFIIAFFSYCDINGWLYIYCVSVRSFRVGKSVYMSEIVLFNKSQCLVVVRIGFGGEARNYVGRDK